MSISYLSTCVLALFVASSMATSIQVQLSVIENLVEITQGQLIAENCQTSVKKVTKRNVLGSAKDHLRLEMLSKLHDSLLDMLIQCRQGNPINPDALLPTECKIAINLTETWRRDHDAFGIWPIHGRKNGDTKRMISEGRPWFRFSGSAGNKMFNKCAPYGSCGAAIPLYSKSAMPTQVGAITSIVINGANQAGDCKFSTDTASVILCSQSPNDYVYRYDGDKTYDGYGFCGMKA